MRTAATSRGCTSHRGHGGPRSHPNGVPCSQRSVHQGWSAPSMHTPALRILQLAGSLKGRHTVPLSHFLSAHLPRNLGRPRGPPPRGRVAGGGSGRLRCAEGREVAVSRVAGPSGQEPLDCWLASRVQAAARPAPGSSTGPAPQPERLGAPRPPSLPHSPHDTPEAPPSSM